MFWSRKWQSGDVKRYRASGVILLFDTSISHDCNNHQNMLVAYEMIKMETPKD